MSDEWTEEAEKEISKLKFELSSLRQENAELSKRLKSAVADENIAKLLHQKADEFRRELVYKNNALESQLATAGEALNRIKEWEELRHLMPDELFLLITETLSHLPRPSRIEEKKHRPYGDAFKHPPGEETVVYDDVRKDRP